MDELKAPRGRRREGGGPPEEGAEQGHGGARERSAGRVLDGERPHRRVRAADSPSGPRIRTPHVQRRPCSSTPARRQQDDDQRRGDRDVPAGRPMKQYLLSIYQPDGDPPPPAALDEVMRSLDALHEELRAAGAWVFVAGPPPPSTGRGGRIPDGGFLTTDGPLPPGQE